MSLADDAWDRAEDAAGKRRESSNQPSTPATGGEKSLHGQVESPSASNLPPSAGSNNAAGQAPSSAHGTHTPVPAAPSEKPQLSATPRTESADTLIQHQDWCGYQGPSCYERMREHACQLER